MILGCVEQDFTQEHSSVRKNDELIKSTFWCVLVCLSRCLEVPVDIFALNATMSWREGGLRSAVRSG